MTCVTQHGPATGGRFVTVRRSSGAAADDAQRFDAQTFGLSGLGSRQPPGLRMDLAPTPAADRVLCEHALIRGLVAEISEPSGPIAALPDLGVALADHLRLEENSLFPLIEQTVPAAVLARVVAQLTHAHA
jgi:hypothetical protein